jgi:hypothetical protein
MSHKYSNEINEIVAMLGEGFRERAKNALAGCNGNTQQAIAMLLDEPAQGSGGGADDEV